ncbi:MAG: hypothetical protein P4N59_33815 [Negativicutes bacterium]|nr:hypothetical protein [Negativicutes bacterium]
MNSLASLELDTTTTPKSVTQTLDPFFNEEATWPYQNNNNATYIAELKSRWEPPMVFTYFGDSQFSWMFNNKKYYSSLVSFEKKDALKNENQDIAQLFMFNQDRTIASISPITIKKQNAKKSGIPFFLEVKAMAIAKATPDTMLIIIGYIDSKKYLADPHGDLPESTSTILLHFSDESGKLKIEQDDNCLGNPNKYSTIAGARKALKQCLLKH